MNQLLRFNFSGRYRGYGAFLLRMLVSARLIYGVQDNIRSWEHMIEFQKFLAARGVEFPLAAAVISVYVQFICGVLILIGLFTRIAAIPLIINFIAALYIAHMNDTFLGMFQALTMLVAACFFLLDGPGKLSIDKWLDRRHLEPRNIRDVA